MHNSTMGDNILYLSYPVPPIIVSDIMGPQVIDSTVMLVMGESTTISLTIIGGPTPTNTIQPLPGSTTRVPPSLTVSGNTVMVENVDRNDQGTYLLLSINSVGSDQIEFTIVVECESQCHFVCMHGCSSLPVKYFYQEKTDLIMYNSGLKIKTALSVPGFASRLSVSMHILSVAFTCKLTINL